jgi:hypothetical protein
MANYKILLALECLQVLVRLQICYYCPSALPQ